MSVFSPIDVQAPDQRRKQLLQRLFQQAQQSRAASGSLAAAGGPNFRSAMNFRPGVFSMTSPGNIMADVMSRLGVLGHDLPGDFSPGQGHAIGPPQGTPGPHGPPAGVPIAPPGPPGPPGGGGQAISLPSPGAGSAIPPESPVDPSQVGQAPNWTNSPVEGRIPLGGGMFYDQHLNQVVGSPYGAGSAAINLSGGRYTGGGFGFGRQI